MIGKLVAETIYVDRQIGAGSFGDVYHGTNVINGEEIALKVERHCRHLRHEFKVYRTLEGGDGIPKVYSFCQAKDYNVMVMELLGPSLKELFRECNYRFTTKTLLMLADQMIERLKYLHSKHFVHCDIKPDNIAIGRWPNRHKLYLIDFGMARQYRCQTSLVHISYRESKFCMVGTPRYASIGAHLGKELSRRDDMESLGYLIIYFHKGRLPWQGLTNIVKKQKYEKICELKMSIPIAELCHGLPEECAVYLGYCRNLRFEQEPDYEFLQNLFGKRFCSLNLKRDQMFDWMLSKPPKTDPPKTEQTANTTPTAAADDN